MAIKPEIVDALHRDIMESQCDIRSTNLWRTWELRGEEKEENMRLQWKIGDGRGNDVVKASCANDGTLTINLHETMSREDFKSLADNVFELFDIAEEEAEE